jgi:hypothetical protein
LGVSLVLLKPALGSLFRGEHRGYAAEIVLLNIFENGPNTEAGLRIPYDPSGTYSDATTVLLSPDRHRVLYTLWDGSRIAIYVTDVDGENTRRIAEQEVAEGSGELDVSSIVWGEDSKTISYSESGITCEVICDDPEDFSRINITYRINVLTGEKSVVN